MTLKAAKLDKSARLQRVRDLLSDGRERSTREIIFGAHVCAVNSVISELRANGLRIECRAIAATNGGRIWLYRLDAPASGLIEATREKTSGDEVCPIPLTGAANPEGAEQ